MTGRAPRRAPVQEYRFVLLLRGRECRFDAAAVPDAAGVVAVCCVHPATTKHSISTRMQRGNIVATLLEIFYDPILRREQIRDDPGRRGTGGPDRRAPGRPGNRGGIEPAGLSAAV